MTIIDLAMKERLVDKLVLPPGFRRAQRSGRHDNKGDGDGCRISEGALVVDGRSSQPKVDTDIVSPQQTTGTAADKFFPVLHSYNQVRPSRL